MAMSDIPGCHLCIRLWRAFADATMEHIRLDNELRIATLQGDVARIADLTPKCEAAGRHRSNAREATKCHKAEAHPQSNSATA